MRKSSIIVLCLVLSLVPATGFTKDRGSKGNKHGKHKETICHKGKTITVSESAVQAHLRHGDSLGPCAQQRPPVVRREEHPPVIRKYTYLYYPDLTVYFDQGRSIWFYLVNGKWASGRDLPSSYTVGKLKGISVELDTDRPYTHHKEIIKKYPTVYHYTYYPGSSVYFDERRKVYYYETEGKWEFGSRLPEGFHLEQTEGIVVDLDTDRPYTHHKEIIKKYPTVYHYTYYPGSSVYFDERRKGYYYEAEGKWEFSTVLPGFLQIIKTEAVEVSVENNDPPYTHHREFMELYPPGQHGHKETICHKGKTITVAKSAGKAHIGHGDTIGPCPTGRSDTHHHNQGTKKKTKKKQQGKKEHGKKGK